MFAEELARANARFEERIRELSMIRRVIDALKHIQDARKVVESIIDAILCVQLVVKDNVVGVMNMSHPQTQAFSEEDRRLMTLIADQVAIALHNVQLFDRTLQINDFLEQEVQKATEDLRQANEALQAEIDKHNEEKSESD